MKPKRREIKTGSATVNFGPVSFGQSPAQWNTNEAGRRKKAKKPKKQQTPKQGKKAKETAARRSKSQRWEDTVLEADRGSAYTQCRPSFRAG